MKYRRRHRRPDRAHVPTDTGGTQARETAEAALDDAARRREDVRALLALFHRELTRNHFAESITIMFRGEHP